MELGNGGSCPFFTAPGSAHVVKRPRRDCGRVFPFTEKVKVLNVIMREKVTYARNNGEDLQSMLM